MDLTLRFLQMVGSCDLVNAEDQIDKPLAGVTTDSRQAQSGQVFFALRGDNFDGHDFVAEAFHKGIRAAVVRRDWFSQNGQQHSGRIFIVVEDPLVFLQKAANAHRRKSDLPVIAITGSNGKTTTKELVAQVLETHFKVLKSKGNLNNHIGVPLTLFELRPAHEIAVIEMGTNHFGEIASLCQIAEPTHGLITNIGRGHLEFFGSLEGVAKAKAELFESMRDHGTAFVNADDTLVKSHLPPMRRVVRYSFQKRADVMGEFLGLDARGCPTIRVSDTTIRIPVPGQHNIYNALAAITVGLEFGVELAAMKQIIEDFTPLPKRMEVIERDGLTLLNDTYNSNPDSAKAALEVLVEIGNAKRGRKIAVLGDMLELGEGAPTEHARLGEIAASLGVDGLFAFGPNSRLTVEAARGKGLSDAQHFESKVELVATLSRVLRKDDVVLVKGSRGMKMEEVVEKLSNYLTNE